jgi:hypothetical protein
MHDEADQRTASPVQSSAQPESGDPTESFTAEPAVRDDRFNPGRAQPPWASRLGQP